METLQQQEEVDIKLLDVETRLFDAKIERERHYEDRAIKTSQSRNRYTDLYNTNKATNLEENDQRKIKLVQKELRKFKAIKENRNGFQSPTERIKSANLKALEKVKQNLKIQELMRKEFYESTMSKHKKKERHLQTLTSRKAMSPDPRLARQKENYNLIESSRKSFGILTMLKRKLKDRSLRTKQHNNLVMYTKDLQKAKALMNKERIVREYLSKKDRKRSVQSQKEEINEYDSRASKN
ncbi:unnamed protein product [Moneuplotes crassus]|uniref:Uncharacterized protein n=1 Tax=Euplotes crassus TaxID=5936 RepID=A0AAD1Y0L2_EUPCR|nr:unnamed protein product [Moneuplotes crassus]